MKLNMHEPYFPPGRLLPWQYGLHSIVIVKQTVLSGQLP